MSKINGNGNGSGSGSGNGYSYGYGYGSGNPPTLTTYAANDNMPAAMLVVSLIN